MSYVMVSPSSCTAATLPWLLFERLFLVRGRRVVVDFFFGGRRGQGEDVAFDDVVVLVVVVEGDGINRPTSIICSDAHTSRPASRASAP